MIPRSSGDRKLAAGNRDREGRALADDALDREVATVVLYDLLGQCEPEAATALFGREERVEQPGEHLGGDTDPGVLDLDHDAVAGPVRAQRHLATSLDRNGLGRVAHEVDE